MAMQPTIDFRADRLERRRQESGELSGDGMVDDMMLAGEIEELFSRALQIWRLDGEELAVMRLRIRAAASDSVDLVTEDFRRRELLV